MDVSIHLEGQLYKTFIKDMPTLFYLITKRDIYLFWNEQWTSSGWTSLEEVRDYIIDKQKGELVESSPLQFVLEVGKSIEETFLPPKRKVS